MLRKKMLDYLIDKELITRKGNLYIYNPENAKNTGLNFGALKEIRMLDTIKPFLEQFIAENQGKIYH